MKTNKFALDVCLFIFALPGISQTPPPRQQQIEAHIKQAQVYLSENKPDQAAAEFKAIIALDPKNVDAHGNLGVLLYFQGAFGDAIPQLRSALKLQPSLWKIQALPGMAERRSGDINGACTDLEKAFPKLTEPKMRIQTGMELIELYSAVGELGKAAETVNTLRELDPTNVEVTSLRTASIRI
jgi:Tfp pilus assembly protein PilF